MNRLDNLRILKLKTQFHYTQKLFCEQNSFICLQGSRGVPKRNERNQQGKYQSPTETRKRRHKIRKPVAQCQITVSSTGNRTADKLIVSVSLSTLFPFRLDFIEIQLDEEHFTKFEQFPPQRLSEEHEHLQRFEVIVSEERILPQLLLTFITDFFSNSLSSKVVQIGRAHV